MASNPITTMNVSLPEAMRELMDERMKSGGFANTSEYIRHLIRNDLKLLAQSRLDELLIEGLCSGPGRELTPRLMNDIRERAKARATDIRRGKHKKAG